MAASTPSTKSAAPAPSSSPSSFNSNQHTCADWQSTVQFPLVTLWDFHCERKTTAFRPTKRGVLSVLDRGSFAVRFAWDFLLTRSAGCPAANTPIPNEWSATRKLSRNDAVGDHVQCRLVPSNGLRSPGNRSTNPCVEHRMFLQLLTG